MPKVSAYENEGTAGGSARRAGGALGSRPDVRRWPPSRARGACPARPVVGGINRPSTPAPSNESIQVDLRHVGFVGVKAYGDVTLPTPVGEVTIKGFCVISKNGEPPWVGFPSTSYQKERKPVNKPLLDSGQACVGKSLGPSSERSTGEQGLTRGDLARAGALHILREPGCPRRPSRSCDGP